jgi:hypothetical protein
MIYSISLMKISMNHQTLTRSLTFVRMLLPYGDLLVLLLMLLLLRYNNLLLEGLTGVA